jgi:hypothetical protein
MLKYIYSSIFVFFFLSSYGQKHDYNWIFGRYSPSIGAVLNFSSLPINILDSINIALFMDNSQAAISDKNGNLLFYCNGYRIANSNHQIMINGDIADGDTLNFDFSSVQGSLIIIPNPKNINQYYLFTVIHHININGYVESDFLKYSIVDVTANNGNGAVTNKLVTIVSDTISTAALTAVKHADGIRWWVLMPEKYTHNFYAALVGFNGIEIVKHQIRNNITTLPNIWGAATFSPNGEKYIYKDNSGELKVFDFNRCTGELSNEKTAPLPFRPGYLDYGAVVSHSNRFLYICYGDSLFQYDLFAPNLANSKVVIATTDEAFAGGLLAPDNKIYLSATYSNDPTHNELSVIDKPDSLGIACNFLPSVVHVPVLEISNTPNYPNYRLGAVSPNYCDSIQLAVALPQEESGFYVYPNPASNKITLEYSKMYQGGQCEIYNLLGEKVFSFGLSATENKMQINISKLPAGMYSLRLQDARAGVRAVQKLVIE